MEKKELTDVSVGEELPSDHTRITRLKSFLKFGKKGFVISAILLSFLVVCGGVYAYNNLYLAPEKVIERASAKMEDIKTYNFSAKASLTINSSKSIQSLMPLLNANTFSLYFDGGMDFGDENKIKTGLDVEVKSGALPFLKAKMLGIGEDVYMKLEDASGLENILQIPFGSIFGSEWVKAPKNDSLGSLPETPKVDPKEFTRLLEENNPLKITNQLPSDSIDGMDMFHYAFELDKEKLKTLIIKYQEIMAKNGDSQDELGVIARDNINKAMDKLELRGGEVWIGKKDQYFRKIILGVQMKEDEMSFGLDLIFNFKDFNKDLKIEEPKEFKTSEEVMKDFQTKYLQSLYSYPSNFPVY